MLLISKRRPFHRGEIQVQLFARIVTAVIKSVARGRLGFVPVAFGVDQLRSDLPIIIQRLIEMLPLRNQLQLNFAFPWKIGFDFAGDRQLKPGKQK